MDTAHQGIMASLLAIPGPLKSVFDMFPLKTYGNIKDNDQALDYDALTRTAYFMGPNALKANKDDVFQLGVYQIVRDPKTGVLLASDPWGIFAELSLCKKNDLQLPTATPDPQDPKTAQKPQHSMCILSARASVDKSLPILIESYTRRHIRSTKSINEILFSRIPAGEQTLYLKLLNTIVYDGYLADLLTNASPAKFCELYTYINERDVSVTNSITIQDVKRSLLARNNFNLRHQQLTKYLLEPMFPTNRTELAALVQTAIAETIRCLKKLQIHWRKNHQPQEHQNHASNTQRTDFQYIDLALASYVLAIAQLGPDSELYQWMHTDAQFLLEFSHQLLQTYSI